MPKTKKATSRVGRRAFLKQASAAAAVVAFPTIIPSSALGADGRMPPSERINLGFIGIGKQMRGHLHTFAHMDEVQILALCDVESRRLADAKNQLEAVYAERFGAGTYEALATYKDFRELCARDDLDGVVIATPNHWHAIPAIEAARSGKDVYLEKPLARTIGEATAIRRAVQRYGAIFQTGSQQRSDGTFRFACEMVRSGRIGDVKEVYVNVGGPPVDCYLPTEPTPEGLDWDMWLGPAPWRPYHSDIAPPMEFEGWPNWRSYRDYAGGGMTDFGAHHFDIAQWGLGMDHTAPVEVAPPDGRNHKYLTYRYESGVLMYHGAVTPQAAVEFVGTTGRVRVNRGSYLETDPVELKDVPLSPSETHLYKSTNHHKNWLECMRTRTKCICDEEIGAHSATVCHIGNIAYWLNRPLQWDPIHERFIGDEEANRLVSRPMRAPWRIDI